MSRVEVPEAQFHMSGIRSACGRHSEYRPRVDEHIARSEAPGVLFHGSGTRAKCKVVIPNSDQSHIAAGTRHFYLRSTSSWVEVVVEIRLTPSPPPPRPVQSYSRRLTVRKFIAQRMTTRVPIR